MSSLDLELVRHALTVARQRGYVEVELGADGWEFSAQLDAIPKPAATSATAKAAVIEDGTKPIKAPLVGYFSLGKGKGALKVGQQIKTGEIIAGITALGIENEVEAPLTGEILELLVKDGDPVEFGQVIAVVKTK